MYSFNRYWQQFDSALKPTQGYTQDARRFLTDLEPILKQINLDRSALERIR